MPAVARLNDICTGHGCFSSRPATSASPNVFANGIGIHRVGDSWAVHCCGPACHPGTLGVGSPNVFSNGNANGRVGDLVDCGSTVAVGSPNVFS